jgi:hypothetical protein
MIAPRSYDFSKGVRGKYAGQTPGITHVNRKGKTYHLQHGTDTRGKERYWLGQKITGNLVTAVPEGYEIFEKPDSAQVFLRKIEASAILPPELEQVRAAVEAHLGEGKAIVELEGDNRREIVVYITDMDVDTRLSMMHAFIPGSAAQDDSLRDFMLRVRRFDKMLRFTLMDAEKRHFSAERWCFLGSMDQWIWLAMEEPLPTLLGRYVKHLGHDSFYELM